MLKNLFTNIPENLPEEVFDLLLLDRAVKIVRIVSMGQSGPEQGWYDQDDNEWVLLLQGEAVLEFENGNGFHLQSGDFLDIPAHQKHRVRWTPADRPTLWLAVHYK